MKPSGILTIPEIAGHPKFHRPAENPFKLPSNSYRDCRSTFEQVRNVVRCVPHTLRKLGYRETSLTENVGYRVARR